MSADNWRVCPECEAKLDAAATKIKKKADDSYGKITRDEFEALVAKATEARRVADNPDDERCTFREDYSLGVGGQPSQLSISYRGECQACGFGLQFAETHDIPKGATPSSFRIGRDYKAERPL